MRKLFKVEFEHWGAKSQIAGTLGYYVALEEDRLIEQLEKEWVIYFSEMNEYNEPITYNLGVGWIDANPQEEMRGCAMWLSFEKNDEDGDTVYGPPGTVYKWLRSDPNEPTDCYYGYTSYAWDEGQPISEDEVTIMVRFGMAIDLDK